MNASTLKKKASTLQKYPQMLPVHAYDPHLNSLMFSFTFEVPW